MQAMIFVCCRSSVGREGAVVGVSTILAVVVGQTVMDAMGAVRRKEAF